MWEGSDRRLILGLMTVTAIFGGIGAFLSREDGKGETHSLLSQAAQFADFDDIQERFTDTLAISQAKPKAQSSKKTIGKKRKPGAKKKAFNSALAKRDLPKGPKGRIVRTSLASNESRGASDLSANRPSNLNSEIVITHSIFQVPSNDEKKEPVTRRIVTRGSVDPRPDTELEDSDDKYLEAPLASELTAVDKANYQIGSRWGRRPLNETTRNFLPNWAQVVTQSMGVFHAIKDASSQAQPYATATYLGNFRSHSHTALTSAYAIERLGCKDRSQFSVPSLGFSAQCEGIVLLDKSLDLAVIHLAIDREIDGALERDVVPKLPNSLRLEFMKSDPGPATKLFTMGSGRATNIKSRGPNGPASPLFNMDSDCLSLSSGEPETVIESAVGMKIVSLPVGCDASHGDQGSLVFERETGLIAGLMWTSGVPKSDAVQDSHLIIEFLKSGTRPSENILKALTYMVPATELFKSLEGNRGNNGRSRSFAGPKRTSITQLEKGLNSWE